MVIAANGFNGKCLYLQHSLPHLFLFYQIFPHLTSAPQLKKIEILCVLRSLNVIKQVLSR